MNSIKADICKILDSCTQLGAIDKIITIAQLPKKLEFYQRRCSHIFFSRCVELSIHLDKIGHFLLQFPSGWSAFNWPDGTEISLLEGQEPLEIIHRLSD